MAEVEFEVVVVPDVVVVRHLRVDPALFTAVPPVEPVTPGRTLHRDNMYRGLSLFKSVQGDSK